MGRIYEEDLAWIHHTGFEETALLQAPGLLAHLRAAGIRSGLVVDLGCGGGLWARALGEAGYDVLGIDASPAMIALARAAAPGARLAAASLYEVEIPPCAAVTALGEVLGYLGGTDAAEEPLPPEVRDPLPALLRRLRAALRPGGLLWFDLLLRSGGAPRPGRAVRSGPGWRVEAWIEEDPARSLLVRRIRTERLVAGALRRGEEIHRLRTFDRGEVEGMLRDAGFSVRVHRRCGAVPLPPGRLAFRARVPGRPAPRRAAAVSSPPAGAAPGPSG